MAGGIGSRFWPMSTPEYPKQFHDILGTGRTMIQQTYDRIKNIIPTKNIFVITNTEYIELTKKQLPDLEPNNIVGEPLMKNTSACNIYMTKKILQLNPEANIIVLPADHLILKENTFYEKIDLAFQIAKENDYLITLGITPTRPDTGYGYIQYSKNQQDNIYKVKKFTEKPNLETANKFLATGEYLWNAGIFVWNAKNILKAFKKHLPEMAQLFDIEEYNTNNEKQIIDNIYTKVENISIDNGILEKADNVFVIPSDLGWSDLGTWTSVFENSNRDTHNNTIPTNCITYNSIGNIVRTSNNDKTIIIDELSDFIVVDTEKALLICPLKNDQMIKKYVNNLENRRK